MQQHYLREDVRLSGTVVIIIDGELALLHIGQYFVAWQSSTLKTKYLRHPIVVVVDGQVPLYIENQYDELCKS